MKKSFIAAAIAGLLALPGIAGAQSFPDRTLTMIIPFAAGGPTDVLGRIMAQAMGEQLKQTVIVENVGGAGGMTGGKRAADAKPDGYTMLLGTVGTQAQGQTLYKKPLYNAITDFTPVGLIAEVPIALLVRKDLPAKDLKEFTAYLKKEGESVKQAHGGIGSSSHMACLLLTAELGAKPTLVAYRGTGPALNDVIGGHVDFFCEQVVSVQGAIKGGSVKGIVVSGNARSPALPDVPNASEAGVPAFKINIWSGIFAPKNTPKAIVAKLSEALNTTLNDPAVAKRLVELGGTVPPVSDRGPDFLAIQLKADIASWNPILKAANEKTN